MNSKQWALIVGGLLPAIGLGVAAMFQKLSGHAGIATGPFLMIAGCIISLVGGVFWWCEGDFAISPKAIGYTALYAAFWATSCGLIAISLRKLGGSMSQIVPLYNMNTLVAIFLGMILLAEWKTVHPLKIAVAGVLIVGGGILASKS